MSKREILFRGKRIDNGEWVCGVAFPHDNNGAVTMFRQHPADGSLIGDEVIPETVGRYTGLTDKNGTRIFEGDILGYSEHSEYFRYLNNVRFAVFYDNENACFSVERYVNGNYECTKRLATFNPSKHLKVIGNIHDNPELLKEG